MHASKEEAVKALVNLEKAACLVDGCQAGLRDEIKRCLLQVQNFLEVSGKKLPREESYAKEKARR